MSPTPAEIRALLDSAVPPLTAYAAAPLAGVTPRQMQRACTVTGDRSLSPSAWRLLKIMVSASARKDLPTPVAP